jgi:hypothetical protein
MSLPLPDLDERVRIRLFITGQLKRLPLVQALGMALGIAVDLAKSGGMDVERFVATAYVTFEHCDGTPEEAHEAMQAALAAVRAVRAKRG